MIETVKELVAAKADTAVALAKEIWGYAELSYEETKSAAALIAALKAEGQVGKILVTGCLSQRYQGDILQEMPEVDGVHYIERGYEDLVGKLSGVGADIRTVVVPDEKAQPQVG